MIPRGLGMYVYLNSLKKEAPAQYVNSMKEASTFNLENINKDHQNFNPVSNAIELLKRIEASESAKEHQAILTYLNKLDKHLHHSEIPLPEDVKNMLQRQYDHLSHFNEEGYKPDEFHPDAHYDYKPKNGSRKEVPIAVENQLV